MSSPSEHLSGLALDSLSKKIQTYVPHPHRQHPRRKGEAENAKLDRRLATATKVFYYEKSQAFLLVPDYSYH